MKIQNYQNQTSFQAKFLHSDSLQQLAQYSVEHGKFDKLNTARKNIDSAFLSTRLKVDIFEENGKPGVSFTRFVPKKNVLIAKYQDDFEQAKVVTFKSEKKCNPLKFALEKIIKLSNNAPHNNMYKNVVITK
jgi:hypothetical protein